MKLNFSLVERLDFWTCFFLKHGTHIVFKDSQVISDDNENDDSVSNESLYYGLEAHKYYCKSHGAFLTGSDYGGHIVCFLLNSLIIVVGLFGVVTNILNVVLLRKSFPGKGPISFKEALVLLSIIELILSLATVGFSIFTILIMENFSRSYATIQLFQKCNLLFTVTRTMSVYITILITMERYLVVVHPVKSKAWLYDQPGKSRIALISVVMFAILLNLPWILKTTIVKNEYQDKDGVGQTVEEQDERLVEIRSEEFMDFPYLIKRNDFAKNFNRGLQETMLALDFVVPLPLLLIFNALLYISIRQWNMSRATLSGRQKSEINTAKMFSIVVVVLLSCHSVACAVFFTSRVVYKVYRELFLLQNLAVVCGTSANFLVYYYFKSGFQREFWGCMRIIFGNECSWINRHFEKFRKDSDAPSQNFNSIRH